MEANPEHEKYAPKSKPDMSVNVLWEYKLVQVTPHVTVNKVAREGVAGAEYFEKIINKWAVEGWEFWRVDSINVGFQAGCLSILSGNTSRVRTYYLLTFRRPRE